MRWLWPVTRRWLPIGVPIDIEADSLSDVAQLHEIVIVDRIGFDLRFLSIHKNTVGGKRCFQRFHRLRCWCA